MKEFSESFRYEYDLNPSSIVIDCGGYEGNWAREIIRKYGCKVIVFEPVKKFHDQIKSLNESKITLFHNGVGASARIEQFTVNNDSTGVYCQDGEKENVSIVHFSKFLFFDDHIDLLKLNIEGMEYEVLNGLIETGTCLKVKNIQVQFHHCHPDSENQFNQINLLLLKSHSISYQTPNWCGGWINYKLNEN